MLRSYLCKTVFLDRESEIDFIKYQCLAAVDGRLTRAKILWNKYLYVAKMSTSNNPVIPHDEAMWIIMESDIEYSSDPLLLGTFWMMKIIIIILL